ncbi:unnamed protein product [Paramecium pentaurelia]|uniref:Uncharacterized protein n=1 Tax=Paramecium pentaurelia TaxID=43138 RepID=A0A8S1SRK1_9CILI|nr:unnamed protein product [Paramecium pentaurelia]
MSKVSRFSNIKNEMEKQQHLDNINQKSKKQQVVFNNPFFKQQDDQDEQENFIESKIQQLQDVQVVIPKELNLQIQHKVKSHIIDHKLKNNYDYVRLKYIIRIWREQSIKLKISEEQAKQQLFKAAKENMIDDMIKNQKYEKLRQQQEQEKIIEAQEDEKSQMLELEERVKQKKQTGTAKPEQQMAAQSQVDSFEQKNDLFKMPDQDLIQYIPYCTDIYLGKD